MLSMEPKDVKSPPKNATLEFCEQGCMNFGIGGISISKFGELTLKHMYLFELRRTYILSLSNEVPVGFIAVTQPPRFCIITIC